ncbi:MAG: efflux RND transporter permease subunit, partial [Planctomycetes bacterium]|nr:efflux RND transporter permease subunit [Planctomycetota bacterium]
SAASLESVAVARRVAGAREFEREDRRTVVRVTANFQDNAGFRRVSREVSKAIEDLQLPDGYEWSLGRTFFQMDQDMGETLFALGLACALVFLLLASLFESFVHPVTIFLTVPFSLLGAWGIFWLVDKNMNILGMFGVVALVGVAVNNGIVLVAHVNDLRAAGEPREEALVRASIHRLRPILMTTLTTLLGLLPMVAPYLLPEMFPASSERANLWAPLGLTILGGLLVSTVLSLIILPSMYSVFDSAAGAFRRAALSVGGGIGRLWNKVAS